MNVADLEALAAVELSRGAAAYRGPKAADDACRVPLAELRRELDS